MPRRWTDPDGCIPDLRRRLRKAVPNASAKQVSCCFSTHRTARAGHHGVSKPKVPTPNSDCGSELQQQSSKRLSPFDFFSTGNKGLCCNLHGVGHYSSYMVCKYGGFSPLLCSNYREFTWLWPCYLQSNFT